jgi:hypothetical protein
MGKNRENIDQNGNDNLSVDFEDEDRLLNNLMFKLDVRGAKSLAFVEKEGSLISVDSGISGRAKIHLIMKFYFEQRAFFEIAIQKIKEIESGDDNNTTVH